MRRIAALPLLAFALVAAKDDPLAGRIAGKPQQCISPDIASGPQITDTGTIIYRRTNKRLFVSTPIGTCRSLRPLTTLVIERYGSQICRGDRFRVIDPPSRIPSPFCRFGAFVPWDKPPK